ncbi:MAG TPA: hypothetical protein VF189_02800 [Patescibacteria group bacterium]
MEKVRKIKEKEKIPLIETLIFEGMMDGVRRTKEALGVDKKQPEEKKKKTA